MSDSVIDKKNEATGGWNVFASLATSFGTVFWISIVSTDAKNIIPSFFSFIGNSVGSQAYVGFFTVATLHFLAMVSIAHKWSYSFYELPTKKPLGIELSKRSNHIFIRIILVIVFVLGPQVAISVFATKVVKYGFVMPVLKSNELGGCHELSAIECRENKVECIFDKKHNFEHSDQDRYRSLLYPNTCGLKHSIIEEKRKLICKANDEKDTNYKLNCEITWLNWQGIASVIVGGFMYLFSFFIGLCLFVVNPLSKAIFHYDCRLLFKKNK